MIIRPDDLRGPEIASFLEEHLQDMRDVSLPESKHALDIEGLRRPEISFWTVWDDRQIAGCGALKELDAGHGELKSMRTSRAHRRHGVASILMNHLIETSRCRGYRRLSLETGSMPFFEPARRLYARFGFVPCGPFADYRLDPNSVFLSRLL
jgi:putative acetyltransferase